MRVCEVCGCSEPPGEVKRDPDELREPEQRSDELDRQLKELELETADA